MRVFYVVIRATFGPYPKDSVSLVRRDRLTYDLVMTMDGPGGATSIGRLTKFTTLGTVHVFRSLEDANRYWNRVFFADEPDRVLEIRRVTAWFRNAAGQKAIAGEGELVDHHAWTRVEHNQLGLMRKLSSDDGRPG